MIIATREKAIALSKEDNLDWADLNEIQRNSYLSLAKEAISTGSDSKVEQREGLGVLNSIVPQTPPDSPPLEENDSKLTLSALNSHGQDTVPIPGVNFFPISPTSSPPPLELAEMKQGSFIPQSPVSSPPVGNLSQSVAYVPESPPTTPPPVDTANKCSNNLKHGRDESSCDDRLEESALKKTKF